MLEFKKISAQLNDLQNIYKSLYSQGKDATTRPPS